MPKKPPPPIADESQGGTKTFYLLREDHAPKLGQRSTGKITFQVLTDANRQALFVRVARNDGGGYVSDEAVPFNAIVRCINERDAERPIKADLFRAAFVGRSSNNWGFMTAILVHEGLLQRDKTTPHHLVDAGGWAAWGARQLQVEGELSPVRVGKEPLIKKSKPPTPDETPSPQADATQPQDAGDETMTPSDEVTVAEDDLPVEPMATQDLDDHGTDAEVAPQQALLSSVPDVTVRRKGRLTLKKG